MKNNQYNFLKLSDLPKGNVIKDELSYPRDIIWAKTSQFNDLAKNHCGAIFVTNLALYYTKMGYDHLRINNTEDTFNAVHSIVGNGPKMFLAKRSKLYFSQRGYTLKYSTLRSRESIKKSIAENKPVAFLLGAGIFEWHWVMAVGWVEYDSGEFYIKIVTGWDSKVLKYYKLGSGSCWLSATSYTIEEPPVLDKIK